MFNLVKRLICSVIQRSISIFYKLHKNDTYIFMFHDIGDVENLSILEESFKSFIEGIQKNEIPFKSIDDAFRDGPKAILTFDDVYESAVLKAVPYLNEKNIPYTLFMCPSLVDTENHITSEQILGLKENPLCTIAFHSVDHIFMRGLSEERAAYEICATEFEDKYKIKCDYFAYPYGSVYACSRENISMLKDSEYRAAFGTVNSATNAELNRRRAYYIPRINVCEKTWHKALEHIR